MRNNNSAVPELGKIVGDVDKADGQNIGDLLLRQLNPAGRSGWGMERKQVQKIAVPQIAMSIKVKMLPVGA